MSIPLHKEAKVVALFIDHSTPIDPVLFKHIVTTAKTEINDHSAKIAIVSTQKTIHGDKYEYLYATESMVKSKYLYDPFVFRRFKNQAQCETLWHGCSEPSLDEIEQQIKSYRLGE